jgi:uncharacterized membrane protein YqaE (UPF0057 family)
VITVELCLCVVSIFVPFYFLGVGLGKKLSYVNCVIENLITSIRFYVCFIYLYENLGI